jgi:hypothetical protein
MITWRKKQVNNNYLKKRKTNLINISNEMHTELTRAIKKNMSSPPSHIL